MPNTLLRKEGSLSITLVVSVGGRIILPTKVCSSLCGLPDQPLSFNPSEQQQLCTSAIIPHGLEDKGLFAWQVHVCVRLCARITQ